MRLCTWFIGGILIFIARYKHRQTLVLRQFRIVVADTDFGIFALILILIFVDSSFYLHTIMRVEVY